jgi:hypothetical protein
LGQVEMDVAEAANMSSAGEMADRGVHLSS